MSNRAPLAALHELWLLVLKGLLAMLKRDRQPSVELLHAARRFLRDQGFGAPVTESKDQSELRELYRLYGKALYKALDSNPRGGVLAEARHWLRDNGITVDLPAANARNLVKHLSELDLPFTKH